MHTTRASPLHLLSRLPCSPLQCHDSSIEAFPHSRYSLVSRRINIDTPYHYGDYLTALAESWRHQFGRKVPFVIVQLPAYKGHHALPLETGWTRIRHEQYLAAHRIPNSALVPLLDTGEANDIHPQDKHIVGHRVAMLMKHLTYGERMPFAQGPIPCSARIRDGKIRLSFIPESGTLIALTPLQGFSICTGGTYQWTTAKIVGPHTIILDLPTNTKAITVRYAWDDFPLPSLFNTDGLPAPQFEIEVR